MNALTGVRVIDMSEVTMGPYAAQMLADYGADVIKVERLRGDVSRNVDTESTALGRMSSNFAALNRGKRSIALDVKTAEDRDVLRSLVQEADVFLHNYRPGAMERIGMGFDDLSELNPRLIYAVGLGFGEAGPLATRPGQDLIGQSLSGISMHRPGDHLPPYLHPVPFIDYAASQTLACGISMALLERANSGRGQKVTTSLYDTALAMQMLEGTGALMYQRSINWVSQYFPNSTFETSDGWVTILGFFRDNPLSLICKGLGIEDLSADPRYATVDLQNNCKEELNDLLRPVLVRMTSRECVERLAGVDVLCTEVMTLAEVLEHDQTRANTMIVEVEVEGQGVERVVGNPLKMSRSGMPPRPAVAVLNSHSDQIRRHGFGEV